MKTCPHCGNRMDDAQKSCPTCGVDYLEAVIGDLAGSTRSDASLRFESIEEGLRPIEGAVLPSMGETVRRMMPQLSGGALLFLVIAGLATKGVLFYLLAAAAAVPFLGSIVRTLRGRKPLGRGELVVTAAARLFEEDAAALRRDFPERKEVTERLDEMQARIGQALALQAEAHARNRRKILIAALALLAVACIGVGALALRNHAARKAEAEYARQPEWVKLRDEYLAAAENGASADSALRLAVVRAMLDARQPAEAEAFFFAHCQGEPGDIDCALLIAGSYRSDPQALDAFVDRAALRYDSDTRKLKKLKR